VTFLVRALSGLCNISQLKSPKSRDSFSSESSLIRYYSRVERQSCERFGGLYQVVIRKGLVNGFLISNVRISNSLVKRSSLTI
jgi:hypothetical protein